MHQSYHVEFFTATILKWKRLLEDSACKQIIVDSLCWLVKNNRCNAYAFVIMPNHIHVLWKIKDDYKRDEVQAALLSYTAHAFKKYLRKANPPLLEDYYVDASDRDYQFWQRDAMVKECWSESFMQQKLDYIHYNPCQPQWNLAAKPEDYKWSSAAFYETNTSEYYNWLTHYND